MKTAAHELSPTAERPLIRVVFPVSRWTNPHRARRRHLDNGQTQPLCGQKPTRAQFGWEWHEDRFGPTCPKCKRIARERAGGGKVLAKRGPLPITPEQKTVALRSVRLLLKTPEPTSNDYAKVLIALSACSLLEVHCLVAGRYCEWANGAPATITNDDIRAAMAKVEIPGVAA